MIFTTSSQFSCLLCSLSRACFHNAHEIYVCYNSYCPLDEYRSQSFPWESLALPPTSGEPLGHQRCCFIFWDSAAFFNWPGSVLSALESKLCILVTSLREFSMQLRGHSLFCWVETVPKSYIYLYSHLWLSVKKKTLFSWLSVSAYCCLKTLFLTLENSFLFLRN
jgi:hypothetical protein